MVMTIYEFKKKLALKYETPIDNIVIANGDLEFGIPENIRDLKSSSSP
jgi:hypothetical protein